MYKKQFGTFWGKKNPLVWVGFQNLVMHTVSKIIQVSALVILLVILIVVLLPSLMSLPLQILVEDWLQITSIAVRLYKIVHSAFLKRTPHVHLVVTPEQNCYIYSRNLLPNSQMPQTVSFHSSPSQPQNGIRLHCLLFTMNPCLCCHSVVPFHSCKSTQQVDMDGGCWSRPIESAYCK